MWRDTGGRRASRKALRPGIVRVAGTVAPYADPTRDRRADLGELAYLADRSPRCSPRSLTAQKGRVRRRVCWGAVQRVRDTALHSVTGTRGGPRE